MGEEAQRPDPLLPLPEDWSSALAVVAHPDDLEYGAAAAIARWTDQGKRVVYCLATSGEAGIDAMTPEECAPLRQAEERASAAVVGVEEVEFLGFPDGTIEYGLPLRRAIASAVRRHRPEVLVGMNHRESYGPGILNQADHIAVGQAVLDGARDAGNRWVFRDLLDDGLMPWNGVRAVCLASSPRSTHAVDVTATFDRGVASLREHGAYIEGLGDPGFDPEEFLESTSRPAGTRLGTRYAVPFEVFPFHDFG